VRPSTGCYASAADPQLKPEKIPVLYEYARLQFDCGNYLGAAELLYHFRILSMDQDKNLSALWGKFACEILLQNWEAALEDLTTLRQTIENRVRLPASGAKRCIGAAANSTASTGLWFGRMLLTAIGDAAAARATAALVAAPLEPVPVLEPGRAEPARPAHRDVHATIVRPHTMTGCWSDAAADGRSKEPSFAFFTARLSSYRHALQTTSPHLLRYLTAAVIITRRKRETLKELVTMIQQESETFRDPIVEFLDCLYVQFDFDGAQQKLRDCQQVFAIDSFLQPFREDFLESARLFVFETYCKIHRKIDLRFANAVRVCDGGHAQG